MNPQKRWAYPGQRIADTILRNMGHRFYHNHRSTVYDPAHYNKQGRSKFERVHYLEKVGLSKIIRLAVSREP